MSKLSSKLHKQMNKQIQEEYFSAWLYYSMAAWFDSENLPGFAHWMRVQAMEEVSHGQKFFHHILERGGAVELLDIAKPPSKWDSPLDAFEAAYKHEQHITGCIHSLMKIAREENDFESEVGLLNWFVEEQIEEEVTADEMVQKLKLIGDSRNGLYQLDKEIGARQFVLGPDFKW